jgi:aminotransferase
LSSEAFAQLLLREAQVMTMPGSAYGKYGEGYIRISYELPMKNLKKR